MDHEIDVVAQDICTTFKKLKDDITKSDVVASLRVIRKLLSFQLNEERAEQRESVAQVKQEPIEASLVNGDSRESHYVTPAVSAIFEYDSVDEEFFEASTVIMPSDEDSSASSSRGEEVPTEQQNLQVASESVDGSSLNRRNKTIIGENNIYGLNQSIRNLGISKADEDIRQLERSVVNDADATRVSKKLVDTPITCKTKHDLSNTTRSSTPSPFKPSEVEQGPSDFSADTDSPELNTALEEDKMFNGNNMEHLSLNEVLENEGNVDPEATILIPFDDEEDEDNQDEPNAIVEKSFCGRLSLAPKFLTVSPQKPILEDEDEEEDEDDDDDNDDDDDKNEDEKSASKLSEEESDKSALISPSSENEPEMKESSTQKDSNSPKINDSLESYLKEIAEADDNALLSTAKKSSRKAIDQDDSPVIPSDDEADDSIIIPVKNRNRRMVVLDTSSDDEKESPPKRSGDTNEEATTSPSKLTPERKILKSSFSSSSDSSSSEKEWAEIIQSAKRAVKQEKLRSNSVTSSNASQAKSSKKKLITRNKSSPKSPSSLTNKSVPSTSTPTRAYPIIMKKGTPVLVPKTPKSQSVVKPVPQSFATPGTQNRHLMKMGITFDIFEPLPKHFFGKSRNLYLEELFKSLDSYLFNGLLTQNKVLVVWSGKLTSAAGIFHGKRHTDRSIKQAWISLSHKLLQTQRSKDVIETLLHEMIHAFLFVTGERDATAHGPNFKKMMVKISNMSGFSISITHSYHDEVSAQRVYVWRCDGVCKSMKDFDYGFVRRSVNRAPTQFTDQKFWLRHTHYCDGEFHEVKPGSEEYKLAINIIR